MGRDGGPKCLQFWGPADENSHVKTRPHNMKSAPPDSRSQSWTAPWGDVNKEMETYHQLHHIYTHKQIYNVHIYIHIYIYIYITIYTCTCQKLSLQIKTPLDFWSSSCLEDGASKTSTPINSINLCKPSVQSCRLHALQGVSPGLLPEGMSTERWKHITNYTTYIHTNIHIMCIHIYIYIYIYKYII